MLVDDRDPPAPSSARLPEPEAHLDPILVGMETERRGHATSADAGDTDVVTAAAVVVAAGLGDPRRQSEQEQREEEQASHVRSLRSVGREAQ